MKGMGKVVGSLLNLQLLLHCCLQPGGVSRGRSHTGLGGAVAGRGGRVRRSLGF